MSLRLPLLTAGLTLALGGLAAPASAQVAGEDQGVTAVRSGSGHVVRFAKRAAPVYRRIAGRRVTIGCGRVRRDGGGYSKTSEMTTVVRAPRRRQALRTFAGGKADYCLVREKRTRNLVVLTPVTEAGRVYLDEVATVGLMLAPFAFIEYDGEGPVPIETAVEQGDGLIVALDGPDGTPPRDKVGYWTDGRRTATVALTTRGRRLFYETDGDVVRTNVLGYLTED